MKISKLKVSVGDIERSVTVAVSDSLETGVISLSFFEGYAYFFDINSSKVYYWSKK